MSMGIGINAGVPDAGRQNGRLRPAACGVWFTSTGTVMPKVLKFEDEEGMIRMMEHVHVSTSEKKYYCGIPVMEYQCSAQYSGMVCQFKLFYYMERNEWKILLD